jgi:hypothetical protein
LLLSRAATLLSWQPSETGEQALRRLAAAVAHVLDNRLSREEADAYMAGHIAEMQTWLQLRRREQGQDSTREGYGR